MTMRTSTRPYHDDDEDDIGGGFAVQPVAEPVPADDDLDQWLGTPEPREAIAAPQNTKAQDADLDSWLDYQADVARDDMKPKEKPRGLSKGGKIAMALSGIGSCMASKPFDVQFWQGERNRMDKRDGGDDLDRELKQERLAQMRDPRRAENQTRALDIREQDAKRRAEQYQSDLARDTAEADPNSDESEAARQMATQMLGVNPEAVAGMNARDIYSAKPQIAAAARAVASNKEFRARNALTQRQKLEAEGRAQGYKLDEEGRARGYKAEDRAASVQADIDAEERKKTNEASQRAIKGWHRADGSVPAPDTHEKASVIATQLGEVQYWSNKLRELGDELGTTAKLGALSGLTDTETAEKIARARYAHRKLLTAERQLDNTGVPQQFEIAMIEKAEPSLESVQGIMMAVPAYRVVADEAARQADRQMGALGYSAGDAPKAQPPKRPAPKPKPAPTGEATAVYTVTTPSGKTREYPLTAAQAAALKAKGFKVTQ